MDRDPERLRIVGATGLEQRLLSAAAGEKPSPELTRRMARGLGIAVGAGVTTAAGATAAAPAAASTLVWPLVSAAVAALAVTGAVLGWSGTHRRRQPAPPAHVAAPAAPAAGVAVTAPDPEPPAAAPHPRRHRAGAPAQAADLRGEIALLDAVRAAVSAGDDGRAMALLRRYDASFPNGTFRPESAALQVEALAHLGQIERARALGHSFVAAHPDSPLVPRVQRAIQPAP